MTVQERLRILAGYFSRCEEVVVAYLFGSCAQGRQDHLSDIDAAVLLVDGYSREEMWRFELELAGQVCEILETDQVDFYVLNTAPLVAQFAIISTGLVLLSNDETKRTDYEVAVMNRYWDFKRYDEEYDAHFVRRLKGSLDDA
jgi:predicted nucleotidyltransferase